MTLDEAARFSGRTVDEVRCVVLLGDLESRLTEDEQSYLVSGTSLRERFNLAPEVERPRRDPLIGAAIFGVVIGGLLSVAPWEILMIGLPVAFVWILLRGRKRWVTYLAAAAMIALALMAPKQVNRMRLGPFPTTTVSLQDLGVCSHSCPGGAESVMVTLPSREPSIREVVETINAQTVYECKWAMCGTGASLLSGDYPMFLTVRERPDR